jgi:hypothetical protein
MGMPELIVHPSSAVDGHTRRVVSMNLPVGGS